MSSILIHGGNQRKRRETALKLLADKGVGEGVNLIEVGKVPTEGRGSSPKGGKKIGIGEIKALLPHLHVRPSGKQKGFTIFEAQRLTIAAQNALLKILEEPPAHLVIILTAPNPRLLLPTVISRCLIMEAEPDSTKPSLTRLTSSNLIEEIFDVQSGQRLMLFEEKIGYGQEGVLTFLDEVEAHLKKGLSLEAAQLLTKLWQAKKLLRDESANVKLIIDEFLLSTPLSGGESKE